MRAAIFDYKDYREFIVAEIERTNLSYSRFAKKYPQVFTEIALKKLLSRGRTGLSFKRTYSLSNERFSEFLALVRPKLEVSEVQYLTVLKLLNDSEALGSKIQTKYFYQLQEILNEKRRSKVRVDRSENETYIYRALSILPPKFRIRTEMEIFTLLLRQLNRLERSPEVMRAIRGIQNRIGAS